MYRALNIVRYSISLMLPIVVVLIFGPFVGLVTCIVLLLLNNYLDDAVFFFGYRKLVLSRYEHAGLSSPVNGVITALEENVPLYSHLLKCDVLTRDVLVDTYGVVPEMKRDYHHLTVFLNKFNHHIVGNIGAGIKQIFQIDMDGTRYPMVEDGKLVADNEGLYLTNSFVEIVYANGVHIILTLDKYISKAKLLDDDMFPVFICKGSQCDIYIPKGYNFLRSLKKGDKLEIFETIAGSNINESVNRLDENNYLAYNCTNERWYSNIPSKIKEEFGVSHFKLLLEGLKKTLDSYKLFDIAAIVVLLLIYHTAVVPYLFAVLLLFYTDRCIKHLLYSILQTCSLLHYLLPPVCLGSQGQTELPR